MGLLENARYASIERGYDYYKRGNVISFKQTSENEYEGKVSGSAEKPYDVHINIIHLKKSFCNCPFAEGNRKVCKHKIAIYFSAFPKKPKNITKVSKAMMNPSLTMIMTMIILMKMMNLTKISERLSAIF